MSERADRAVDLGYAIYARTYRGGILLTTDCGDTQIYLEPEVLLALVRYAEQHNVIVKPKS